MFEQDLEPGNLLSHYDELDRDLTDHRVGWFGWWRKRWRAVRLPFVENRPANVIGAHFFDSPSVSTNEPEKPGARRERTDGEDFDRTL